MVLNHTQLRLLFNAGRDHKAAPESQVRPAYAVGGLRGDVRRRWRPVAGDHGHVDTHRQTRRGSSS